MIDTKELRAVIQKIGLNGVCPAEIIELLDRLEAAESDALEQARLNGMGASREAALLAKLEAAEKTKSDWLRANAPGGWVDDLRAERDALRARIEEMEKDIALKERIIDSLGSTLNAVANGRDELRAALSELGVTPEEARAGVARSKAIREERDTLRAELDALRKEADKFSDGVDWIQRAMQAEAELETLKAWKEEVEKQEPVGVLHVGSWYGEELQDWEFEADQQACDRLNEAHFQKEASLKLYALPGAKGE